MNTLVKSSFFVASALLVSTGGELHAQTATDLAGTYVYIESASDDIEMAIRAATDDMNFIVGPIARGRLRKTNFPYERIQISSTPETVSIVTDSRAPIITPATGASIKWEREDGEVFDVSTRFVGDALEQTFRAEDGQRVNRFTLDSSGNVLTMLVTVSSPKLPEPMVYSLKYQRQ
ncbi:MAG TPA: hypothetical protein VFI91_10590 [Longimicrobiaceae bacterium]|nr:hypothetical protein [Longimicrobiaceae bacterium]